MRANVLWVQAGAHADRADAAARNLACVGPNGETMAMRLGRAAVAAHRTAVRLLSAEAARLEREDRAKRRAR